jgi:hypothetical protein
VVVVAQVYNSSYSGGRGNRIISLRPSCTKLTRPYLKKKKKKDRRWGCGIAQAVELLPSTYRLWVQPLVL